MTQEEKTPIGRAYRRRAEDRLCPEIPVDIYNVHLVDVPLGSCMRLAPRYNTTIENHQSKPKVYLRQTPGLPEVKVWFTSGKLFRVLQRRRRRG
jgi:hypothetical protein